MKKSSKIDLFPHQEPYDFQDLSYSSKAAVHTYHCRTLLHTPWRVQKTLYTYTRWKIEIKTNRTLPVCESKWRAEFCRRFSDSGIGHEAECPLYVIAQWIVIIQTWQRQINAFCTRTPRDGRLHILIYYSDTYSNLVLLVNCLIRFANSSLVEWVHPYNSYQSPYWP